MDREKSSLFLGLALLIAGLVILVLVLVSVLGLAANPGPFIERQIGGGEARPPAAVFAWWANDTVADFRDLSSSGSASIESWTWDFDDGTAVTTRDATHTYSGPGEYFVRLTVRDANGLEAVAATRINVVSGGANGGMSETLPNVDFDFGNILVPIAVAILTTGMWIVGFLVGGSLVKAGWNLIRPRPETIRIKLRPQQFEHGAMAEIVSAPPASPAAVVAAVTASPPPPPES